MYKSSNVKCADCGDIFRIEYDSRKEKQDVYTCKCGKLKCHPNSLWLFSYDRGGSPEKLSLEEENYKSMDYDEDFIKLTDEQNELISEIRMLCKVIERTGKISFFDEYINKKIINFKIANSDIYDNNSISIVLRIDLYDNEGWKREYEKKEREKRIEESLNNFRNNLIKIKNGELSLDDPREVWRSGDLEFYNGYKTQRENYDYELYC